MAEHREIAQGMQVVTSDGELLGTVEAPTTTGFMLRRMGPSDPTQETIPDMWVHSVDQQVHLNRTGAEALAGWKSLKFETSSGERPGALEDDHDRKSGPNWMVWILVAVVALVALAVIYTQIRG